MFLSLCFPILNFFIRKLVEFQSAPHSWGSILNQAPLDHINLVSLTFPTCCRAINWTFLAPKASQVAFCLAVGTSLSISFLYFIYISSVQFSSVTQSCPTLCNPMNCSMPGLPVHHQLLESTQTHVHWVGDAIQPSHPLSSFSPPALNLSQHQGLFKRASSLH